MRVVLDTNVLVSAFASPSGVPGKIYRAWSEKKFELVISDYILQEFGEVAVKKLDFQVNQIAPILDLFNLLAQIVKPQELEIPGLDTNDIPIIGRAVAGKAKFVVTGDQKILKLKKYDGLKIIRPREFLNLVK